MRSCDKNPCVDCPNDNDKENAVKLDTALASKNRKNMPVVYLSGPMTGYEDFNFPRFNEIARRLRLLGFHVLNPADFGADPSKSWDYCLERDLLLIPHADVILLLEGWENSKGAGLEFDRAISLGIPAVTEDCFIDRVVRRVLDPAEYNDLMDLDTARLNLVIARFSCGNTEIVTRETADLLLEINESYALLTGAGVAGGRGDGDAEG